jgi:Flp pilus assembly pilin Flp
MLMKKTGLGKQPRRWRSQMGATLFEYTLIIALVSIVGVIILTNIGRSTVRKMTPVTNGLQ